MEWKVPKPAAHKDPRHNTDQRVFIERNLSKFQKHILALLRTGCKIREDRWVVDGERLVCYIQYKSTLKRLLSDGFIRWDKGQRCWIYIP